MTAPIGSFDDVEQPSTVIIQTFAERLFSRHGLWLRSVPLPRRTRSTFACQPWLPCLFCQLESSLHGNGLSQGYNMIYFELRFLLQMLCPTRLGSEQALAPVRLPDTFAEGAWDKLTNTEGTFDFKLWMQFSLYLLENSPVLFFVC